MVVSRYWGHSGRMLTRDSNTKFWLGAKSDATAASRNSASSEMWQECLLVHNITQKQERQQGNVPAILCRFKTPLVHSTRINIHKSSHCLRKGTFTIRWSNALGFSLIDEIKFLTLLSTSTIWKIVRFYSADVVCRTIGPFDIFIFIPVASPGPTLRRRSQPYLLLTLTTNKSINQYIPRLLKPVLINCRSPI